jgi:hypothetical protein
MSATDWEPDRPWVRQPFDSDIGFALFGDFLVLPLPRRLSSLVRPDGPLTLRQIERIAHEAHWQARASFWDEHLANIRTTTIERVTEETAEDIARRQLGLTRRMQRLADGELVKLEKLMMQNDFPGLLTARDALRLGDRGIRLERLILGEATERTEVGPDLKALSIEDLREMRRLQAKAGIR